MTRIRELGLVLLTAAVIFFAVQNYGTQGTVAFLWWEFAVPISLITLVPLLIGLLVGAGSAVVFGHRRGKRERERMRGVKAGAAGEMAEDDEDEAARLLSDTEPRPETVETEERAGSERST